MPKHFRRMSFLVGSLFSILFVFFQNFTIRQANPMQSGDCLSGNFRIRNGEARTFFRKSFIPVGWGNTCSAYSLSRRCSDGKLSGEPLFAATGEHFDKPSCISERDRIRPVLGKEALHEFETRWVLGFNDEFVKQQVNSPWTIEDVNMGIGMWLGGYRVPERAEIMGGRLRILNRLGDRAPYPPVEKEIKWGLGTKTLFPSQTESAQLISNDEFGYGYFETRAKISKGGSIDSAFWLMNDRGSEIDIYETFYVNDNKYIVNVSAHPRIPNTNTLASPKFTSRIEINEDLGNQFHIYGVLWRPDIIVFYMDGNEQARITDPVTLSSFTNQKLKIRLSTAMSNIFSSPGGVIPPLDDRSYNSEMVVDYVRYFYEPHLRDHP